MGLVLVLVNVEVKRRRSGEIGIRSRLKMGFLQFCPLQNSSQHLDSTEQLSADDLKSLAGLFNVF
jgi:hypothetical protein